jgi:hypothetical protein
VHAGDTATIDVLGWSTAATEDWSLSAAVGASKHPATNPITINDSSNPVPLNNGVHATLKVQIPANAVSGDWSVIDLYNARYTSGGGTPPGEDYWHTAALGLYVP